MKKFLKKKIKPKKGDIMDPDGNILGKHDGVYYYTIGQRIRPRFDLNIKKKNEGQMPRWYVAKKDVKKNILVVAPNKHEILYRDFMVIKEFHLISDDIKDFKKGDKVYVRIRHVGELISSKLKYNKKKNRFELKLSRKISGVSNGQAVVLYKGRKVLGGGVIGE
jgi:tRNA-specific 2-thiouridylase